MDANVPFRDRAIRCQECKQSAVTVVHRTYECGCAERIIYCIGCDHTIWASFVNVCNSRKDIIITTENPNTLH